MTHHPALTSGYSIDDHVRGRQVHRAERSLVEPLIGFLVGTAVTCVLFWQEWATVLIPCSGVAMLICCRRLHLARLASRASPVACGPRGTWRHTSLDTVMSLTMAAGPVWIFFHSDGLTKLYMMVVAVSLLWAGALVHLSIFHKAATFMATQMALWIAIASWTGWDRGYLSVVVLVCLTGAVAMTVGYQISIWLENGLRQKIQLEARTAELRRQTETIGLLLREHEAETSDWLWHADASLAVRHVSSRFAEVFARSEDELDGLPLPDVLAAPEIEGNAQACRTLEDTLRAGRPFRDLIVPGAVDGERRWWSVSGRPVIGPDEETTDYRGVMTDVTREQQAKAEVLHLAHYDSLTDLPNRLLFLQRLETRLCMLGDALVTVIYLDLDGFKLVNDRYGHAAGDALLVMVAERLQAATTNNDIVGRLSGDEFVIKTRITDREGIEALCRRLLHDLGQPFAIDGQDVVVGASLGIAIAPADGTTAEILLKSADAALYRAKQGGRGTYRFFAAELDHEQQARAELLQDLRNALPHGELVLHYQPFVEAGTGVVTGYEALIRWQHPHRGLVSPLEFVPLAEESGLIVSIGAWVIQTACAEASSWADERRVSVNLSPVQFQDRDLPDRILESLLATGLPAHRLEIELTESIFVSDIDQALTMLRRIRALGVRVALDDFGTGYSSLSYLRSFPFDKIKIDRSFVRDLSSRPDSQVIVRAVGDIARGLNMTVTAEGVETPEQVALLQLAGCHELQGYLYGRPTPPQDLTETIENAAFIWRRSRGPGLGVAHEQEQRLM